MRKFFILFLILVSFLFIACDDTGRKAVNSLDTDIVADQDLAVETDSLTEEDVESDQDLVVETDSLAEEDVESDQDLVVETDFSTEEDVETEQDLVVETDFSTEEDVETEQDLSVETDSLTEQDLVPDQDVDAVVCKNSQCLINGKCVDNLEKNKANICQQCDIDRNKFGWSFSPATTLCRKSVGICDKAEYCTGNSFVCPTDVKYGNTKICYNSQKPCVESQYCDGVSNDCQKPSIKSGKCFINDACYSDGDLFATSECLTCQSFKTQTDWSMTQSKCDSEDTCGADGFCFESNIIPTNQDKCYDNDVEIACPDSFRKDFFGQDAQYDDASRKFIKKTINSDEVVADTFLSLFWYVDTTNTTFRLWSEAKDYCENLNYAGKTDWRLPSVEEFSTIVDYSKTKPAVDSNLFPVTLHTNYLWTSTEDTADSELAFIYSLYPGTVTVMPKTNSFKGIICVRGDVFKYDGVFTSGGTATNETFKDTTNHLVWTRKIVLKNWKDALNYCENLDYANHTNWRLPNINELITLLNYSKNSPASNYPFTPNGEMFSSTTSINNKKQAFVVDFTDGSIETTNKTKELNVRCVR